MPAYFDKADQKDKKVIIKWLLDHDPSKRPTAREVLDSQHLPPLEMEEARFQDMIQKTVSNNESRGFKHLLDQLFSQTTNAKDDILYDVDNHKVKHIVQNLMLMKYTENLAKSLECMSKVKT